MRIASFQIIYFHPGNTAKWQNVGNRSWLRSVNVFWEIPGVTDFAMIAQQNKKVCLSEDYKGLVIQYETMLIYI